MPLLQALLYRQRDELAKEREAVKTLQRGRAADMKAVREEEAAKYGNLLSDLKSRYWSHYNSLLRISWLVLAMLYLLYRLMSNRNDALQ